MKLEDKALKLTPKRIEACKHLGIEDAQGLLAYYPFRYEQLLTQDYETWKPKDKVTFEGEVVSPVKSYHFKRRNTVSSFDVASFDHILRVTIYNRPWAKQLQDHQTITITGIYQGNDKVTATNYTTKAIQEIDPVTPVYSTKAKITQSTIRTCIDHALAIDSISTDLLPASFIAKYRLCHRHQALKWIHQPKDMKQVQAATRTLKYEEFLKFFLAIQLLQSQEGVGVQKEPRKFSMEQIQKKIQELPFALTPGQSESLQEILKDMQSTHVMYRLVQGDVGCGKTVVACLSLYACALSGKQGVLLAPTEILARQHYQTLTQFFHGTKIPVGILYSGQSKQERNETLQGLQDGTCPIVVGTHSLLQDEVQFKDLGLVIADEQQRFGVAQRRALKEKGTKVDFLLMSATPIPRTLAGTLYGDMDISTIQTLPEGRKPVKTVRIEENSFRHVLPDVMNLLASGRQLYVICAAIEDSEDYGARNVQDVAKNLTKLFAPTYTVGLLHGKMSSEEKQKVMQEFADNQIQVLVCTTVVEVGMNVVNATGMIVYDADRFGLSQLHQLRGRIQRGSQQGQCWLLTDSKEERVEQRLQVLVESQDGFQISYEDLRLRGPGDILGLRQSGVPDFILGNVVEDTDVITTARKDAKTILQDAGCLEYQPILHEVKRQNQQNGRYMD